MGILNKRVNKGEGNTIEKFFVIILTLGTWPSFSLYFTWPSSPAYFNYILRGTREKYNEEG